MTATTLSLGEFAPDKIFLVSYGIPAGQEVDLKDMDPFDVESSLPFGLSEVQGSVDSDGIWQWDGEGDPRDWNRNTIMKIQAWKE